MLKGRSTLDLVLANGDPPQGKGMRRTLLYYAGIFNLLLIVAFVAYLEWTPYLTQLIVDGKSTFQCIPATYPKPVEPNTEKMMVGDFLQGRRES